jgi:hypothetical protein
MTPADLATGLAAAAAVVAAFVAAAVLVRPVARRSGLGWGHPGWAWLLLAAVFLGVGSTAIALTGEALGPAFYVAAAVSAFGIGLRASDRLARRRGGVGSRYLFGTGPPAAGTRGPMSIVLAAVAILAIAPTLVAHGIPFLATDITGARSELVGLPVQLIRVALPGLAAVCLFDGLRTTDRNRRLVDGGAILAIGAFMVLLASRYLLAELAAVLVLAWLLAGRRIPVRLTIVLAALAIVGFAGIQVLRAYDQAAGNELGFAVGRTVNRIVLVQPRTLAALQQVIPAEEPYFLGLTWLHRLGPLVGRGDIPNLGYWIYPQVVEGAQDTAGYAAPGLIGEAWANFGPLGLLLFLILGALAERLGALLSYRRLTAADIAAGAMASLFLARTHALGLGGVAILIVLVLAWRLLAGPPAGLLGAVRQVAVWRPVASPAERP